MIGKLYIPIKISLILSLVVFGFSCTSFDDDINIETQDYRYLSTENIKTPLKIVELIVDQTEFDIMYSDRTRETGVDAFLNVYISGNTLIEGQAIELELKCVNSSLFDMKPMSVKFKDAYHN